MHLSSNHNQKQAQSLSGVSSDAFENHPGYRRMFAPDKLTLGVFLPLRFYQGSLDVLQDQSRVVQNIDRLGFAAIWVRDVPLFDPAFGDAGQVFDPFTYLAYLAAKTKNITLATGSAIFTLRHPIDLAKAASTIDNLSGGRLVMGIASGDRPSEFPAYGIDMDQRGARFKEAVSFFRQLTVSQRPEISSILGNVNGVEFLPQPTVGRIPLIITGSSRQTPEWVAHNADGWLTYPQSTHTADGPRRLAQNIAAWRAKIPDGGFRPHMTNEWIDLVDDPDFPRTPLQGGYVLRTGRKALVSLLEEWREAGVNHAALGIQFAQRPPSEIIEELAQEVLPLFPALSGSESLKVQY
ncbi:LLM class oxidoreductase [Ochrobactrum sp. BTU1]|uniref:LLM class oxidoreductase n=1 Tax=Ochrobactrum sp. BTU1 TaxID=2840456 RepID=UPI001C050563|nr:LLM class oxidoreductase [Ochrobactrum sp. BTU1]